MGKRNQVQLEVCLYYNRDKNDDNNDHGGDDAMMMRDWPSAADDAPVVLAFTCCRSQTIHNPASTPPRQEKPLKSTGRVLVMKKNSVL